MKKILFIFMLLGMVQSIMAQPAARRKQAQQKAQQSNADNMTLRAKLYFPTAIPMDEDVVWRRDIYRELNLTDDANAVWKIASCQLVPIPRIDGSLYTGSGLEISPWLARSL